MTGPVQTASRDTVIVHSSDLHVDDGYTARSHGGDGTRGLAAVLATARAARADLVLLAGDMFEHNRLADEVLEATATLLAAAAVPVIILPGNHDPAIPNSAYHRGGIVEAANVHVLGVTHEDTVSLKTLELEVWGRAHRDYGDMAPLAEPKARRARWHIAMAHGHYHPEAASLKAPRPAWLIGDEEIAETRADYVALGHWNQATQVGAGPVPAYYSGSPDFAGTVNLVRLTAAGTVEIAREQVRWPETVGGA